MSQSYYALLECLATDHMPFISTLEPTVFLYIMATISDGLIALCEFSAHGSVLYINQINEIAAADIRPVYPHHNFCD